MWCCLCLCMWHGHLCLAAAVFSSCYSVVSNVILRRAVSVFFCFLPFLTHNPYYYYFREEMYFFSYISFAFYFSLAFSPSRSFLPSPSLLPLIFHYFTLPSLSDRSLISPYGLLIFLSSPSLLPSLFSPSSSLYHLPP